MEEVTEYILTFKDNTDMYKAYDGEFISEDSDDTDELFEQFQEQVEQYIEKTWVRNNDDEDWYETDVNILYNNRDKEV